MGNIRSRFAIGDKVRLTSGGPEMLVVDLQLRDVIAAYRSKKRVVEIRCKPGTLMHIHKGN